jgi:undecaprenyl-diphosphatase
MDASSLQPFFDWISQHLFWAGIVVFLISISESLAIIGLFVPGVALMFGLGTLIALGTLPFWSTVGWAVAGAIVGDGVSYWFGRHLKNRVPDMWPFSRRPRLLERGKRFFERHGGKSIIFGRFVGPVRAVIPMIAGMLHMSPWRFTGFNIFSAIIWAPLYLLPGIIFGASLNLASEVASRLTTLIVVTLLILWLGVWSGHRIYRFIAPRTAAIIEQILTWSRNHRYWGHLTRVLLDPQQPEAKTLTILAVILMLVAWLILTLFQQFSAGPPLARLDQSVYNLLQGLRTPWGDQIMITISQLGEGVVATSLVITLAAWLILKRHWLALAHWLAAGAFAAIASWTLKQTLHMTRPGNTMYDGGMSFSFPSAHAVLATCLYGFLATMIAREVPFRWRWPVYSGAWLIILSIGFSRLYLGAHWLSDIIGGILLGLLWTTALGTAYRRHLIPKISLIALFVIPTLTLSTLGAWYVADTRAENLTRYERHYTITTLPIQRWLTASWRDIPVYRIDAGGKLTQPLNVQWAGPLDELKQHLLDLGWQQPKPLTWTSALLWLTPSPTLDQLPLLPSVHNGRHAALVLTLPESQLLLRLWPADITLDNNSRTLWVGYVTRQRLMQYAWLSAPSTSIDFDTPLQQFKPFIAPLPSQIAHRTAQERTGNLFWRGEVLLLWSPHTEATTP